MYKIRPFSLALISSTLLATSFIPLSATSNIENFNTLIVFVQQVNSSFIEVLVKGSHQGFNHMVQLPLPTPEATRNANDVTQELIRTFERLNTIFAAIKYVFNQYINAGPQQASNMVCALKQSCGGDLKILFEEFIKAVARIRALAEIQGETELVRIIDTFAQELGSIKRFWDKQDDRQLLTKLVRAMGKR